MKQKTKKLNQLESTAICGNDISSSVLYVSALSIAFAGQYAWITLLIVSFVLFLFRKIYGEVVGALPLNGGVYNVLLNTTSKSIASFAATLTLLSYMATTVISANEAIHYLHHLIPSMPILIASIGLLSIFAILTIIGITESAKVAVGIFLFHLTSLFVLSGFIIYFLINNNGLSLFFDNWEMPIKGGSISKAIFFGFAASMLGVSGFESSANFVEEQKKGVFPKTLKNMWIIVSVINPLMAVFALSLFTIPMLNGVDFQNTLLIKIASHSGGKWLAILISIDAFLVLSGAVLTGFVGVSGLLERMTLDRVLPQFFLKKNKKGSSYRIIITFFVLAVSVLLITKGNVSLLAGVYAISFLFVMALFGIGNLLLKIKRSKLPRPEKASTITVLIAIVTVLIALSGNILMKPKDGLPSNLSIFLVYFIPSFLFIMIMLSRTYLLKFILSIIHSIFDSTEEFVTEKDNKIHTILDKINDLELVFFTKIDDSLGTLNKVVLYVIKNEQAKKLRLVHVKNKNTKELNLLYQNVKILNDEYDDLEIVLTIVDGQFNPELVKTLSSEWNIPVNFMFIGSLSQNSKYKIEEFGGVRLIV